MSKSTKQRQAFHDNQNFGQLSMATGAIKSILTNPSMTCWEKSLLNAALGKLNTVSKSFPTLRQYYRDRM